MTLGKHIEEASARVEEARSVLEATRGEATNLDSLSRQIDALTEFVLALGEVHAYDSESIHEKLHELAGRMRLTI